MTALSAKSLSFTTLAAIGLLSFATPAQAEEEAGVAGMDRAALNQAIEEYIRANPLVLIESLEDFRMKQQEEQDRAAEAALVEQLPFLTSDAVPMTGPEDAPIKIVEFFDYNCGFCKRALTDLLVLLEGEDDVSVHFVEMPILGESSAMAAQWSLAAEKQGKYFEYHTALMRHQGQKDEATLEMLARNVGLDIEQLRTDAEDPALQEQIDQKLEVAREVGVRGTPAFVVNGNLVRGYVGYDGLKALVEEARAGAL